jgi:hypothetical protein
LCAGDSGVDAPVTVINLVQDCNCWVSHGGHARDCKYFDKAQGLENLESWLSMLDTMILRDGFTVSFVSEGDQIKMILTHPEQVENFDGETIQEIVSGEFHQWWSDCEEMH